MSNVTQPQDFSDLYTDLLNRIRADTSITATVNQAKRYINIALHDIHVGVSEKLPWAERNDVLRTQQKYNTGTVTITQGSTSLTGASTAWNTNNSFSVKNVRTTGKIIIAGNPDVYTIASVGSDTAITLNDAFVGANVSAETYTYFEDEYALHDDFLRPLDQQFFDSNRNIPLIGRDDFRRQHPRNKTPGKIRHATIVDRAFSGNTSPVRRVRFYLAPDDFYLVPYAFITDKLAVSSSGTEQVQLSADADEPIIPLRYRHLIVFHGLYHWYRDKKNDSRSQEAKAEYIDLWLRTISDTEIGAKRARVRPNISGYRSKARRPYSNRGARRHTTGTAFDEIRD